MSVALTLGAEMVRLGVAVAGTLAYTIVSWLAPGFCTELSTASLTTFAGKSIVTLPSVVGVISTV